MLKEHDGIIEMLFFSGLIHKIIAGSEDGIILDAVSKILDHCRLDLLITDEDGKADIIKFPSSIDGEVMIDLAPSIGDGLQQFEIRLDYFDYFSELNLIEGEIFPKELISS